MIPIRSLTLILYNVVCYIFSAIKVIIITSLRLMINQSKPNYIDRNMYVARRTLKYETKYVTNHAANMYLNHVVKWSASAIQTINETIFTKTFMTRDRKIGQFAWWYMVQGSSGLLKHTIYTYILGQFIPIDLVPN